MMTAATGAEHMPAWLARSTHLARGDATICRDLLLLLRRARFPRRSVTAALWAHRYCL